MFHCRKLLTLLEISLIRCDQESFKSMTTPRYFVWFTSQIIWLCKRYRLDTKLILFVILKNLHLLTLYDIFQVAAHFLVICRSCWSLKQSSSDLMEVYSKISSAYSLTAELTLFGNH